MYEAFDRCLTNPTWHTLHAEDEERFFRALQTVVHNPEFNAERLSDFIDRKRESGEAAVANLSEDAYEVARDHYVAAASAVHNYLRISGDVYNTH